MEDQTLAEGGSQCQLSKVEVVVGFEAVELAEEEDSSRSVDIARTAEAGEGIEEEDEVDGDAAAAADMAIRAAGSVGRMDASTGAAAEVVAGSARRHAPWTAAWLEAEALG